MRDGRGTPYLIAAWYAWWDGEEKKDISSFGGDVEEKVLRYWAWYRAAKAEIWSEAYARGKPNVRLIFEPFKSWRRTTEVSCDLWLVKESGSMIGSIFGELRRDVDLRYQMVTIVAAMKNRGEILSEKADFYPVYMALVGAALGVFPYAGAYKVLISLVVFLIFLAAARTRVEVKKQVSELKEMAGLIEVFLKEDG